MLKEREREETRSVEATHVSTVTNVRSRSADVNQRETIRGMRVPSSVVVVIVVGIDFLLLPFISRVVPLDRQRERACSFESGTTYRFKAFWKELQMH